MRLWKANGRRRSSSGCGSRGLERLEIHYGDVTPATGRSSNDSPDPPLILSVVDADGRVHRASPSTSIILTSLKTDDG